MSTPPMTHVESERTLPFWHQLRWRLVASFVLLATVPLLTATVFTLIGMRAQTEQQVINQLESVVELKHDQINRWLEANGLVMDSLLGQPNQRARLVNLAAAPAPDSSEQAAVSDALHNLAVLHAIDGDPYFHRFLLYNRAGRIVAASDTTDIGKVVMNQPYFASSLEEAYVQPPYYAVGSDTLSMIITHPLRDQQGQTIGVLAGQVNLQALGQIMLTRTGLGESGETYLVSEENNYL
ncbi:MAG TPA: cache domain-containing protein, partial [Herpetosiphonaceae bacterium]